MHQGHRHVGQGEKIRVSHAQPEITKRGLTTFRQWFVNETPLTSNRHHLSYDDCLENKGRLQDCSCSIGSYHCIQCYAHIL